MTAPSRPDEISTDGTDYRARLYDAYVTTHLDGRRPSLRELRRAARRLEWQVGRFLPDDRAAAILDVGCGAGEVLWFLRKRGHVNARGIDVSAEQVAVARSLGLDRVEQADAAGYLRAHPAEFDLITLFDVLEHLPKGDVVALLELVRGALRPDGRAVVHTVNGESPFAGRNLYGDFTHETAFTTRSINQVARLAGFRGAAAFEVEPARIGAVSTSRWLLWKGLRTVLAGYVAVETGILRGHVLSQNLIAVLRA